MIAIATVSLLIALFFSLYKGNKRKDDMLALGLKKDVWLNRVFVQNGLAIFATWLSLASNLNFAIFLNQEAGFDKVTASTVALVVISLVVVVYFVLENFIWQRFIFTIKFHVELIIYF